MFKNIRQGNESEQVQDAGSQNVTSNGNGSAPVEESPSQSDNTKRNLAIRKKIDQRLGASGRHFAN